jgi:hypothetical protein
VQGKVGLDGQGIALDVAEAYKVTWRYASEAGRTTIYCMAWRCGIAVAGVALAAMAVQAQTTRTPQEDAKCLAAFSISIVHNNRDSKAQNIAMIAAYYYLGRLEASVPEDSLEPLMDEELARLYSEKSLSLATD